MEGEGVTVLRGYIKKTGSALGWHIKMEPVSFTLTRWKWLTVARRRTYTECTALKIQGKKKKVVLRGEKTVMLYPKESCLKLFFFFCNSLHAYIQNVRAVVGNSWTVWVCYITLIRVEEMLSILFVVIDENFILLAWGVRITSLHGP